MFKAETTKITVMTAKENNECYLVNININVLNNPWILHSMFTAFYFLNPGDITEIPQPCNGELK